MKDEPTGDVMWSDTAHVVSFMWPAQTDNLILGSTFRLYGLPEDEPRQLELDITPGIPEDAKPSHQS